MFKTELPKEAPRPRSSCIRSAFPEDLPRVARLERLIERKYAASRRTLQDRLASFSKTFLVAEKESGVVGYAEACRWNLDRFDTFEQIREFPKLCERQGRHLYVIFLAVHPRMRRQGIGSKLLEGLIKIAKQRHLSKVQLVSKPNLVNFYGRLGFSKVKDLPRFLPYSPGVLMELCIRNETSTHTRQQ